MSRATLTLQVEIESADLVTFGKELVALVAAANRQAAEPINPSSPVPLLADEEFDALVRSEMFRLSEDERMPDHRRWNNERDVRLPTMAGLLHAYDVPNLLALADRLELRPPLSALGVAPYVEQPEPKDTEVCV